MGKYGSRYNIDLDYTSIDENVFINTMRSIGFSAYKRGNTKQIFCDYEDIEFNIIYKDKKSLIWIKSSASALASFLVDKKVLKYDDMYTKAGYFRDNPIIYNVICEHIVNMSCLGAAPAISRGDAHWSYEFLLHHFFNYITIEYEKKLGTYKPSDTITIGLSEKLIKKLLSSNEEKNKFFEYTKITDEAKNIFLNDLEKIPLSKRSSSSSLFYPLTKMISNSNYSDYIFTLQSYFYNNGQNIQKNNSSEKQSNSESKEDIKTDNSENIIKEEIINYIPKCKDKLKEIKELSKDFEYAIKNDYYKDCDDIESKLNNGIDNKNELNKIIDEINNLYRNAYNKKHNKSSLAYIMDVEENIDLLEHI
ncbi:hypothetical protein [Brachyspira alvinipulli]|uniref:hypothetical protein n=1 Tax=Brachyspira alvinipulli TaxID=84379 RepID=UPI0004809135|nr:hypothetical protein [Brachyspira alvinipulli]